MKNDFEMEGKDLEARLSSPEQERVRMIVHGLPEDTVSLAWRSDLNCKLQATAKHRRKVALFTWVWKPAAGLALAGSLALAFLARVPVSAPTEPVASHSGVESALVDSFVDSTASWDASGDGITVTEAKDQLGSEPAPSELIPEDIGATL